MSQSVVAVQLLVAIDDMQAFVDAHNESTRNPDKTLSPSDIKRLTELDARIESLRILIPGLRILSCPSIISEERKFGYTELNVIFRRRVGFAFRATPEWRQRMDSFRMAVVTLAEDIGTNRTQQQPDNVDVRDLCKLLEESRNSKKSLITIAREFTNESPGNDSKAKSLLRQARRYRHLWDTSGK